MELEKNKYKKSEVLEITKKLKNEYEEKLKESEERINLLKEESLELKNQLEAYKNRIKLNEESIRSAKLKAEEIEQTATLKYEAEVEYLKNFNSKWRKYFKYLSETYPLYKAKEESEKVVKTLEKVLGKKITDKEKISELDLAVSVVADYNGFKENRPMAVGISDNGFNIDEVLNPGELDLEELCKEMGMMED